MVGYEAVKLNLVAKRWNKSISNVTLIARGKAGFKMSPTEKNTDENSYLLEFLWRDIYY